MAIFKKTLLLGLLSLLSNLIVAQDIVYFKNGIETKVLILKVDVDDVEYIKFDNQDGPKYIVDKGTLLKIVYQNGSLDDFSQIKPRLITAGDEVPQTELTMNDVYACREFTFYGLDFSNFSLIEPMRNDQKQEIKNTYFPAWNKFFEKYVGCGKLAAWYRKVKVANEPMAIDEVNKSAALERVVSESITCCSTDSMPFLIANAISSYPKLSSGKIGFVINVQYFDKKHKEAAAYFTFFDIEKAAVISSVRLTGSEAGGRGLTHYWGNAIKYMNKIYFEKHYKQGYSKYIRGNKRK